MTRVLILGANGQLARQSTNVFLKTTDAELTLYLRRASRLKNPDTRRVRILDGDVLDTKALSAAMKDLAFDLTASTATRNFPKFASRVNYSVGRRFFLALMLCLASGR